MYYFTKVSMGISLLLLVILIKTERRDENGNLKEKSKICERKIKYHNCWKD